MEDAAFFLARYTASPSVPDRMLLRLLHEYERTGIHVCSPVIAFGQHTANILATGEFPEVASGHALLHDGPLSQVRFAQSLAAFAYGASLDAEGDMSQKGSSTDVADCAALCVGCCL